MPQLFANNISTTLVSAIAPGDLTIVVASDTGMPTPTNGDYFLVTLTNASTELSWEVVKCTGRSSTTLTVVRGYEGSATSWAAGSKVAMRWTADAASNGVTKGTQWVSVKDYGAIGDGVVDDTTAIANAYAASSSLIFPEGTYSVSSLPNFVTNGTRLSGIGSAIISYTGSGVAMSVDGGSGSGLVGNVTIENLTVTGNPTATTGFFGRGMVHCAFRDLRFTNITTTGVKIQFAVTCLFENIFVSQNDSPTMTTFPVTGFDLDERSGGQTSDCIWTNIGAEGCTGTGIKLTSAAQNTFLGGTSEGNGAGIEVLAASFSNSFSAMDMEANSGNDITCAGLRTVFHNCLSDSLAEITAGNSNQITGGQYSGGITIGAAANGTILHGCAYDGALTDGGTNTRKIGVFYITGAGTAVDEFPQGVNFGDTDLTVYKEGSWTPTPTSLTVVGTPTYKGIYTKIGRVVSFTIRVTSTVSTAATVSSTQFDLPYILNNGGGLFGGTALAVNNANAAGIGVCGLAGLAVWPCTWPALADVTISGTYITN